MKLGELKAFLFRGNVIDLAIAVVIGAAFGALVTAFVSGILTPLIAAVFGQPDFSDLSFTINGSRFMYGEVINALISFVLIGVAIFYFVVVPVNRFRKDPPPDPAIKKCPECLSDIPAEARRCAHCASPQPEAATL
jgi:large conductance mechanosensitive channel